MWSLISADIPLLLWYILVLVFLEGLLSADNALVLAVMVRHLPKEQQKRALRYGIFGAFGFRLIAVLLSSLLLGFWLFKVVGGAYLLYLSIQHFVSGDDEFDSKAGTRDVRGFWATVVAVELADIAFSIDSILAAVAMADGLPERVGANWKLTVVYIGGILGIVTMRYVAGGFIKLLDRFPGLATGAYFLVAWIGIKLVLGGLMDAKYLGFEMPEWLFWIGMVAILVVSLIWKKKPKAEIGRGEETLMEVSKSIDEAIDEAV
jgi:YkoY family integral membrane protein